MRIRAVIFDVYKTLLEVSPPPADRGPRWRALWRELISPSEPRLDLERFDIAITAAIAREHAAARGQGITFPEIYWPDLVAEVLPEVAALPESERAEFLHRHIGLTHTVALMPGVGPTLAALQARGWVVGIASNAQPYTLRELEEALAPAGHGLEDFAPDLRFWSFQHGFSKPDPHAFRLLGARLRARGISAAETLMVGDRIDNDIAPARAQGWQTWHLHTQPVGPGGDWAALQRTLP